MILCTNMALDVPKNPESIELIKDKVFDQYMKIKIMDDYISDLRDYFSTEEISVFQQSILELSDDELVNLISIPFELRHKLFKKLFDAYTDGMTLEAVVSGYIAQMQAYQYSIGYHTSPYDFGPDDKNQWNIKGTESDHRDSDRMMAYYSMQYRHLFKKRHPKFIYAVRSSVADGSHKTDGNWYRGDTLSVIMKVPFDEVVQYVESTVRKEERPA